MLEKILGYIDNNPIVKDKLHTGWVVRRKMGGNRTKKYHSRKNTRKYKRSNIKTKRQKTRSSKKTLKKTKKNEHV